MAKYLRILAALCVVGLVVVAVMYWIGSRTGEIPPATVNFETLSDEQHANLIKQGENVARAADCAACHSDPNGGSDLAGGMPMVTPMGTIYGTNISVSKEHGIGNWTADDLYIALTYGMAPGRRNLYPAMPYTSYNQITRADSDALWLWLMSKPAVEKPNLNNSMMFPFNIRPAVALWNALERPKIEPFDTSEQAKLPFGRGQYLVDVLGHCGECHTPRSLTYALQADKYLEGNIIEGAYAPDLTVSGLAKRGWTADDLEQFFRSGLSPQGVMTFRMFPVLQHSTKWLDEQDLKAISAYLTQGKKMAGPKVLPVVGTPDNAGEELYVGLCAGCHGVNGEGQPHSSVPLNINTTAMYDSPLNLIRVIREGIEERNLALGERMQTMPAYADQLSEQQMADLVNYLRQKWGGQEGNVTAPDVADYVKMIHLSE